MCCVRTVYGSLLSKQSRYNMDTINTAQVEYWNLSLKSENLYFLKTLFVDFKNKKMDHQENVHLTTY